MSFVFPQKIEKLKQIQKTNVPISKEFPSVYACMLRGQIHVMNKTIKT